jgi:8-oxo-dGTP diphosphatase
MSFDGQKTASGRYTVVPRTLSFLLWQDEILLMQIAPGRGAWAGLYNGVGGHIERGEDPLSSAYREIKEETGIIPTELVLCGFVSVDTKRNPGIGFFVYLGKVDLRYEFEPGVEGTPHWIRKENLKDIPLVEDLNELLPKALEHYKSGTPFFAQYLYDQHDNLEIRFAEQP